jgi:hypothetical protein
MRLDFGAPEDELRGDRPRELYATGSLIFGAPSYRCDAPNDLNVPFSAPSSYDLFSVAMLKNTEAWRLPRTAANWRGSSRSWGIRSSRSHNSYNRRNRRRSRHQESVAETTDGILCRRNGHGTLCRRSGTLHRRSLDGSLRRRSRRESLRRQSRHGSLHRRQGNPSPYGAKTRHGWGRRDRKTEGKGRQGSSNRSEERYMHDRHCNLLVRARRPVGQMT